MTKKIAVLEESIADKIKDYQKDSNLLTFDDKHVDKWVNQFSNEYKEIILSETNRLLSYNYITEDKIKDFCETLWNSNDIIEKKTEKYVSYIQFLNIQQKGNSQKRLVDFLEKYYLETKGININRSNDINVKKYVYIDDCMYTGFTLMKDIENWIDNFNPNNDAKLDIIFLAMYKKNYDYIEEKIIKKCKKVNIDVEFYCIDSYDNGDLMWPKYIGGDEYIDGYNQFMEEQKKITKKGGLGFRKFERKESKLFPSIVNRDILEQELLKSGTYIFSLSQNCNKKLKPMGFGNGISLGFGAFFVTCFNISNNCPLAFWWGDSFKTSKETLGKWYPLLPREVNYIEYFVWRYNINEENI